MIQNLSPGEMKSREMEPGSHRWVDCLSAELFLNSCFSDTVFVTLFCTAVETAVSEVHKLFRTGGVPTSLTSIVLVVADGLFGLYGSERFIFFMYMIIRMLFVFDLQSREVSMVHVLLHCRSGSHVDCFGMCACWPAFCC